MIVSLIHPPHYNSTDDRLDPPLGLLQIGTALKKYTDVRINDLSGHKEIEIEYADIYGITVYCSTIPLVREIMEQCREVNPYAEIVVGGAHITAMPDTFVDLVDDTVRGYGESRMIEIATGKKVEYNDFKIDWSLIDVQSYHRTIDGEKSLPILTSLGCPYNCFFCGLNEMHKINKGVRFASTNEVLDNVRRIKDVGINALNIQDDIFTLNKSRLKEILKGIDKLGMKFRCMGRAGYDTEDTYRMLADHGCQGVAWGIESGSQYMLDRMNKKVTVNDNYNAILWCKAHGMDARAFFILGFPGENVRTLGETKRFIIDSDPDQCFCSNFIPYPGTDVYNHPAKYGITEMDLDFNRYYQIGKDGTGGIVIATKWLTKEKFKELELKFRWWLRDNKPVRGKNVQQYEKEIKNET